MGVRNLWEILESCKKTLPLHHLQNKRVCIDLSCWMVQLISVNRSHCAMRDKVYLRGLFHRLRALIALNCTLIFVTDGSIPAIKVATYRRRLKSDSQVAQDDTSSHELTSLRRNMGSDFSCMIKEAKLLGMALGIPCLDGIEEGEAQCALLNSESLCDGCFSSDSDIFLFGARTVYRDICLGEGGYVVCYDMADIERKLGYGRNSLITLGILLGGDYSQGVHGLGRDSACQIVKAAGESTVLQRIASEGMSFAKKSKVPKKQGQVRRRKENCSDNVLNVKESNDNVQADDLFLQVIDAYLRPKCHSADSQAVQRVLGIYPFQRSKLQQACAEFFGWPSEKTDEYILPKIAERDLRRFANLRSSSSDLGVRLSLDQMPLKCPVSGIIKPRKVQGKDAFEVSWENIDGIGTSIVPADLIESACPEKIMEFEEKKAQGKKPKQQRRPKKSEKNETPLHLIDEKLQKLLLDIEHENSASLKNSTSKIEVSPKIQDQLYDRVSTSKSQIDATEEYLNAPSNALLTNASSTLEVGPKIHDQLLDRVPTSKAQIDTTKGLYLRGPVNQQQPHIAEQNRNHEKSAGPSCSTAHEVIDLLSPSPLICKRSAPKFQNKNVERVDVIDLSDSETEVSPVHAERAKELRLFLAHIKEDIL